jgi:DNA polymerase-3 subunit delta
MILILVGDDRHEIEKEINKYRYKIPQQWQTLNYKRYGCEQLSEAIMDAASFSFGDCHKVVVIENCNFREFGESGLELLQPIAKLPESTDLIFTANSLDRRLKVSKFLLERGKVVEHKLIPPWREDLLVKAVETEARNIGLKLTKDATQYLANAIGNDSERRSKELEPTFRTSKCNIKQSKESVQSNIALLKLVRYSNRNEQTNYECLLRRLDYKLVRSHFLELDMF